MADQVVQAIVDWISVVPPIGVYLIFTVIAYLENVLPPVPGDILLAFGGYLAADGLLSLPLIWILTVLASVVGFMNMYWIGYKLGGQIEDKKDEHFLLRFINYRYFRKGKFWMYKYGQWVIFGNRFLAGTRSVISLTAGMSHLKISHTVANSLISSALWNSILLFMGWFIRDNWQVIGGYLSTYGKVILVCIGLLIIIRIFWSKKKSDNSNEEM
ncbi:MAG: DedA family protein [Balneolaceae bacterium]|nr:DedA family protein [Balneolaceae bacterium]MBO6545965.1 DedA family protein [Balneolaceae bacterium]MBO6647361.1 DedA family protein [Balneolaceae bacterium]